MPWWCPKQKVHGIFDALQMLGSHRLNRGSHSRFSWCKGVRLGWFKQKGFGRARKIHDQAMSHVAKSSTIEIIQKPSKPVAVCHDEFICHGSSAVWLRCDWATPPFTRSQESTSGQPGRIQWFMKIKKERRSKHEKWKESSNISWTVDRIEKHGSTGKRHVVSNTEENTIQKYLTSTSSKHQPWWTKTIANFMKMMKEMIVDMICG